MVRAALIGAGYIAREHLDALAELPGVELVAVCDRSRVMAEAAADQYGVPAWFDDAEKMLGAVSPDVVHVTTPPQSHLPLARMCLDSGAHVFLEKPLALARRDVEGLLAQAEQQGCWLIEDHNYLFNPSVQRMLAMVEAGELGEIVHVEALFAVDALGRGSRHSDQSAPDSYVGLPGGAAIDFVTHLAYLATAFVGTPNEVATSWQKRGTSGARFDELRVQVAATGGTAQLAWTSHAQPDQFWLRVHGTKGRATASLFEPLLAVERVRGGPRPLLPVRNGAAVAGAHLRSAALGLWQKLQGRPPTYAGLRTLLARLYDSLAKGSGPPITSAEIRTANKLVWDVLDQEPRP